MRKPDYEIVASLLQATISTGYTIENGKPELAKVRVTNWGTSQDIYLSSVGLGELIESLQELEKIIDGNED